MVSRRVLLVVWYRRLYLPPEGACCPIFGLRLTREHDRGHVTRVERDGVDGVGVGGRVGGRRYVGIGFRVVEKGVVELGV